MHNLLHFPGQIYPVNNKRGEVQGLKAYSTVSAIPNPVDLAVITVPALQVPKVMQECGEKGIPLVVVITAGFKETGQDGKALEDRMLEIARSYNIRIVGPNCLGLIVPPRGLDTTYVHQSPNPGGIAFISQSGAIINTVVDWSLKHDIGFSAVFSVGNQSDLDFIDYLSFPGPPWKMDIRYLVVQASFPAVGREAFDGCVYNFNSVSYTHLTLPTKRIV